MNCYRSLARTMLCFLLLSTLARASPASEDVVLYHLTPLGDLPGGGFQSVPADINNRGQVTGDSDVGPIHAFRWDADEGMIDLGDLPGGWDQSFGNGINDLGQVAGSAVSSKGGEAFLWDPLFGMIGLGDLPGGSVGSIAHGINNLTQVVGHGSVDGGIEAFLWDAEKGMIGLGHLDGQCVCSVGLGINDATQVCGWSGSKGFVWDSVNGMVALGSLTGPNGYSEGNGINNLGQICGASSSRIAILEAFLWDPDLGMIGLGILPGEKGAFSNAFALNDHAQVVGFGARGRKQRRFAFVWDAEHGMRDLNELLYAGAKGYGHMKVAWGNNNAGQVACFASPPGEAVLLTPFVLGDMDCDGSLDLRDVQGFVEALIDLEAYKQRHPDCRLGEFAGDANQDGSLDLRDVSGFIELLLK